MGHLVATAESPNIVLRSRETCGFSPAPPATVRRCCNSPLAISRLRSAMRAGPGDTPVVFLEL